MKRKWRVMLSVIATLFLLGLVMVPAVLADTTATRDIADQTLLAGEGTTVTVTVTTDEWYLVLQEVVPAGWVISDGAAAGDVDFGIWFEGEFRWTNFDRVTPLGTVTATYRLTVPVGTAANTYNIGGTLFDNVENVVVTVGGESTITVGGAPGTTATRDIANPTLLAGEGTTVTVTVTTDEWYLVLQEVVPAGWVISDGAAAGDVDFGIWFEGEFRWTNFDRVTPLGTVTATYRLTVPVGTAANTYNIGGTLFDNVENVVVTVGGESTITVGEAPVPGDYPVLSWWLTTL